MSPQPDAPAQFRPARRPWWAVLLIVGFVAASVAGVLAQRSGLIARVGPAREYVALSALRGKRAAVLVCFGQSNAANYGEPRAACSGPVYSWHLGKLSRAADPLPGAGGDGGSVWTRLGPRLLGEKPKYEAVVIASIAIKGTSVDQWAPGGEHHPSLISTLRELQSADLAPTHLLWQQGENEALQGGDPDAYRDRFGAMAAAIRAAGVTVPIYVAKASRNYGNVSEPIRAAQAALVNQEARVLAGPDADLLGDDCRLPDRTHLNARGLDRCAQAWAVAILRRQAGSSESAQ